MAFKYQLTYQFCIKLFEKLKILSNERKLIMDSKLVHIWIYILPLIKSGYKLAVLWDNSWTQILDHM